MSGQDVPKSLLRVVADGSAVEDRRATSPRSLHDVRTFPDYADREAWERERDAIREHILACTGLLPMPEKCPLDPRVLKRIERDGYTVESVLLETLPGFFLGGNLYRPSAGDGPHPAIINPHGHWMRGRLNHDMHAGTLPGRYINLARQGHVAFAYDMVGYNDTFQLPHDFGGDRESLWGISLLGLQLWNSIRAVDFVESLPDVDPRRIGCTGASGGGSQTFLVSAIEPRIAASAPAVMVSAHMQGGCLCENAPSLRLEYSNVQIAACFAPRPQLLLACTGDWTKDTATVEFPAIESVYRLYDAQDKVGYFIQDAEHNYNVASREACYEFFGREFLDETDASRLREQPFAVESDDDLLALPGKRPLPDAAGAAAIVSAMTSWAQGQAAGLKPRDSQTLKARRKTLGAVLRRSMCISVPAAAELSVTSLGTVDGDGWTAERLVLSRDGVGDQVPALLFLPDSQTKRTRGTVLVHEHGKAALLAEGVEAPGAMVSRLLEAGQAVLTLDAFLTGEHNAQAGIGARRDRSPAHFTTYNRPDVVERAQDVLTALATLTSRFGEVSADVAGLGEAGLWCLLAAAAEPRAVRRLAVDMAQFNTDCDAEFIQRLAVPHIRRAGDILTAVSLYAPRPLLLCNMAESFDVSAVRATYAAAGKPSAFASRKTAVAYGAILRWLLA